MGMADGGGTLVLLGILEVEALGSELNGGFGLEVPPTAPEGILMTGPCHT